MKVIYYGHACFGVQIANRNLLFDPFITGNELAKGVDVGKIPADYILISHAHSDHIEDAAKIAHRTGATLISNYEITVWFSQQGMLKAHPLNHGGGHRFDFGRVQFVNAIHSSSPRFLITPQADFRRRVYRPEFVLASAPRRHPGF